MNNKSCGTCKNMASKPMPRMPRCMAMKPGCNSCKGCNNCCDKKTDCTCNVLGDENICTKAPSMCERSCEKRCNTTCGNTCNNSCARNYSNTCSNTCGNEYNMNWAKKYESSCSRKCDDSYVMPRKYKKCNKGCELTFGEDVDDLPLGMGYVPYQEWDCNVSNACQGLYDGTIFPELVKPFVCTYCYGERSGC